MVRLAAHPRIKMFDPTPLITIDVEVTLPSTTTVPAPEGIVKIGVDVNGAVHTPSTQTNSSLGLVAILHPCGRGSAGEMDPGVARDEGDDGGDGFEVVDEGAFDGTVGGVQTKEHPE